MPGLKGAGLAGATAALAAGLAYLLWVYASSSRDKRATNQRGEGGGGAEKEGARKGGRRDEDQDQTAPAAASEAPKSTEVRRDRVDPKTGPKSVGFYFLIHVIL